MIIFTAALAAILAGPVPVPREKPTAPPAAPANPFTGPYKEAGLPLVLVHSFYHLECCSGRDCSPVVDSEVKATPSGWFIRRTGETIPYGDEKREKLSEDGRFHICILPWRPNEVRCLYVPPGGV